MTHRSVRFTPHESYGRVCETSLTPFAADSIGGRLRKFRKKIGRLVDVLVRFINSREITPSAVDVNRLCIRPYVKRLNMRLSTRYHNLSVINVTLLSYISTFLSVPVAFSSSFSYLFLILSFLFYPLPLVVLFLLQ